MYLYLYDADLKHKRHDGVMKAIETRLTDYDIAGKIIRLQQFANAAEIVAEEVKRGVKTVVIVGNDATFGRVLSRAADISTTFGFLPVGSDNTIAPVLGIPVGVEACETLSRRRVVALDVGWCNNRYFVSRLKIPAGAISVTYDQNFTVAPRSGKMELIVCNAQPYHFARRGKEDMVVHPQDGKLEAFLRPVATHWWGAERYEEPSIFPFTEMTVVGRKPFVVETDGAMSKETSISIRLAKKKISLIVGKERKF